MPWWVKAFAFVMVIIGALHINYKIKRGFYFYWISNLVWLAYGVITREWWLALQFLLFQFLATHGFIMWTLKDRKEKSERSATQT